MLTMMKPLTAEELREALEGIDEFPMSGFVRKAEAPKIKIPKLRAFNQRQRRMLKFGLGG